VERIMVRRIVGEKCLICGKSVKHCTVFTGYVFFEDDEEQVGAWFCSSECANDFVENFANPVFQNKKAYELFRERHPKKFAENVEGKKVLFLEEEGNGQA
jgi:hypothetical protein